MRPWAGTMLQAGREKEQEVDDIGWNPFPGLPSPAATAAA